MSSLLRGVWDNTFGLLVEDGALAIGIVAALAVAWALATYAGEAVRDATGWVLLVLLVVLTLGSLYRAGRDARRRDVRGRALGVRGHGPAARAPAAMFAGDARSGPDR